MKEYGVEEENLFHEDDLLGRNNIPKVARCIKQIAIIVSVSPPSDKWDHVVRLTIDMCRSKAANSYRVTNYIVN